MKKILTFGIIFLAAFSLRAQKYITNAGFIELSGEMPFEDIKAYNILVKSILDSYTGGVKFKTFLNSFHFKLTEIDEPFNKKFVESDKYPLSEFKGIITNIANVNFKKAGSYRVFVEGELTIHNVTKKVTHNGIIEVSPEGITAKTKFKVRPADYNIELPTLFGKQIAKEIRMAVFMKYTPIENMAEQINASLIE